MLVVDPPAGMLVFVAVAVEGGVGVAPLAAISILCLVWILEKLAHGQFFDEFISYRTFLAVIVILDRQNQHF